MTQSSSSLILPGDPGFDEALLTPRPDWGQVAANDGDSYAFVAEPGSGLMRPVTQAEKDEYLWGGEYDERLEEIGDVEDFDGDTDQENLEIFSPNIWLPVSVETSY